MKDVKELWKLMDQALQVPQPAKVVMHPKDFEALKKETAKFADCIHERVAYCTGLELVVAEQAPNYFSPIYFDKDGNVISGREAEEVKGEQR